MKRIHFVTLVKMLQSFIMILAKKINVQNVSKIIWEKRKNIEQEKIAQYLFRFQEALSQGKVYNCITIVREGVAEYPNNFALLNKLMYALFIAGDDDGNIPVLGHIGIH